MEVLPRDEVGRRVDRAVVVEVEQRHRVDLEVEVVRRPFRITGVADEAEHGARLHLRPFFAHGEKADRCAK